MSQSPMCLHDPGPRTLCEVMGIKDGVLITPAHHTSKNTAGPSIHRKLDGETQTIREGGPSSTGMHTTPALGQIVPGLCMDHVIAKSFQVWKEGPSAENQVMFWERLASISAVQGLSSS